MVTGGGRTRKLVRDAGIFLVLSALAAAVIIPMVWIVGVALKPPGEYFDIPPVWFSSDSNLQHFRNISGFNAGYRALLNSFIVAICATSASMVLGTAAAYGLARLRRRGDVWSIWFLSQRILPPVALVIPVFLLIREIGWIDTYQGLILPYIAINTPFVVWMMRGYFLEIPTAIEESAMTDGCGRWSVLFRVVLPLVVPGLLATGVFVWIYIWSEFLIGLFITQTSASITAAVQLPSFTIANDVLWGEMSAFSLLMATPVLILGLFIQRYFVRGLTLGAVKG
ncbi:MAG: carbohydrate ABC transporter permease [Actinomycetia bacterium]|nr:carbohydrate ABC transporter permease [Actinomycetes bacterium]